MKKKYYLEAVRITAVLLVMYNHSAPFMSFATQHGVQYAVSFFILEFLSVFRFCVRWRRICRKMRSGI